MVYVIMFITIPFILKPIYRYRDIRAIIVGKSGSGKTTLLMRLLLESDMLDYDNLTVCGNEEDRGFEPRPVVRNGH